MRFVPFLLVMWLLAACGQTGDLYLPGKTPPASTLPDDREKKKEPTAVQPTPEPSQPLPDTSRPPSTAPKP